VGARARPAPAVDVAKMAAAPSTNINASTIMIAENGAAII